jgi:hypothetical protein
MGQDTSSEDQVEVSIQELRLRPGTELKLLDSKGNMLAHKAQFIAVFAGKSMLISMMVDDARKIALREGDAYLVKGFTGKYDFSFFASVLQVDGAQFNARLSCPNQVSVKFVRSHLRVQLSLNTSATLPNVETPAPIIITDLSAGGAGIDSASQLGGVGERIQLALPVEFEKKKINLHLTSEIRHVTQNGQVMKTGVEFVDASQHDKLMLHYLVSTLSEGGAVI